MNYYNEIDPFAAQWLRFLILDGIIAPGEVDERSIEDVRPSDLVGFRQCHFFAGIGVWSYALRNAGWSDDRPVWTGSCPCQPFSAAGKGGGTADERHLWPAWFWLIEQCRPGVVFGEQVEAAIKHGWLDLVQADLEGIGYAVGAAGIPAAGVGAPHIRQRLYFVADSIGQRSVGKHALLQRQELGRNQPDSVEATGSGATGELADSQHTERRPVNGPEQDERDGNDAGRSEAHGQPGTRSQVCELAVHQAGRRGEVDLLARRGDERVQAQGSERLDGGGEFGDVGDTDARGRQRQRGSGQERIAEPGATNGFWQDAHWLPCIDGKARPVEPGTFPLAHGAAARVGRLRAYGNAIVPQVAEEVIRAYLVAASMQPAVIPESA